MFGDRLLKTVRQLSGFLIDYCFDLVTGYVALTQECRWQTDLVNLALRRRHLLYTGRWASCYKLLRLLTVLTDVTIYDT